MKLDLKQGAYEARSPIANAQVCLNLYSEPNPPDAPYPVTHYPGPGLQPFIDMSASVSGFVRGLYHTSFGNPVFVIGTEVYSIVSGSGATVHLGTLASNSGNPVSLCDNGTTLVIVDGSPNGYTVPLPSLGTPGSMVPIVDSAFYGSPRVDFIDTFLVFTQPGTNNFYTTTSNVVTPFDPTYFAAKEGWNDKLVTAACLHDNIWLLGYSTTEVWYNAGGATFPFARMPNSILQQGCLVASGVVIADNAIYWISQDRWGRNMCMRGEGYSAKRVSTFAVEDAWSKYPTLGDAVGMVYQLGGHETIGFYFPSANAWWAYDASVQLWHQRTYNGLTQPWLPYCMTGWDQTQPGPSGEINQVLVGDRTGGRIFAMSRGIYTDNGVPITRQRSWAHIQQDGNRLYHSRFALSFAGASLAPDTVSLDWSDDGGQSYGTPVNQTTNNQTNGQYIWRRLGYARDRVYRATWSGNGECALNGAYGDATPGGT